mmetsp:Transcript_15143/g.47070  ORF Transcript_15143/g.47070 Transcript_15143/m.47070 type:complete len:210 (-) Transcript_15143:282-911(-)
MVPRQNARLSRFRQTFLLPSAYSLSYSRPQSSERSPKYGFGTRISQCDSSSVCFAMPSLAMLGSQLVPPPAPLLNWYTTFPMALRASVFLSKLHMNRRCRWLLPPRSAFTKASWTKRRPSKIQIVVSGDSIAARIECSGAVDAFNCRMLESAYSSTRFNAAPQSNFFGGPARAVAVAACAFGVAAACFDFFLLAAAHQASDKQVHSRMT